MSSRTAWPGQMKPKVQRLTLFVAATLTVVWGQVNTVDRTRYPCPRSCSQNPEQLGWSSFYEVNRLNECGEPMLLTVNTFIPVDDTERQLKIRACTTGNADTPVNALTGTSSIFTLGDSSVSNNPGAEPLLQDVGRIARRATGNFTDPDAKPPVCYEATKTNATAQWLSWKTEDGGARSTAIMTSLKDSQQFLKDDINCEETVIYGYLRGSLVGIYVGGHLQNKGIATGFVQNVIDRLSTNRTAQATRTVAQVCGAGRNSDNHVGVVIDPKGDLAWVQKAVRSWAEARCIDESSSQGFEITFSYAADLASNVGNSVKTRDIPPGGRHHQVQAIYGDSMQSMASKCSISIDELRSLNHFPAVWKPYPYQWVYCSSGRVSKRAAPKPRPDGTCASYVIKNDDTCSKIGLEYGITTQEIYDYNKETWAWAGCNGILPGQRICVGPGTPRLPAANPDAECGPSKPGTESLNGQKVEDLSPCPIKACCNVWGNCGVDRDFCVPTNSETGNAGTAAPNTNGCVQNCGMEIVNSGPVPSSFMKVGYFEAWNKIRPCLHMSPKQIPSGYTHIHYSFVDITPGFGVGLGRFADVFEQFKTLQGTKKIIAFGGWAFSTEPETYMFFRNAVKPENRNTFADACVSFVTSHGLDGVDFDWEYPAEPDIPGIPAGDAEESLNYLEFVKIVRSKMPSGKTVSIAAPASYWYLKQFLIEDMAKYVDYIIYMTYDLHGQWDYGAKWTQSGCSAGNCLRSHVNMTETLSALAMVTKAGVPNHKIIVGISSYGRSFQMTDTSCTGPMCTYTGPESGAEHGKCTETGGYIANGEIKALISAGRVTKQWTDDTQSDYVIFGDTWVAYMSDSNKQARTRKYQSLGFGGTTDWAIDLEGGVGNTDDSDVVYLAPPIYTGTPAQCIPPCIFVLPPSPLPSPTIITIPAYTTSIQIQPGIVSTITVKPPSLTVTSMNFWNVNISMEETTGFFQPTYSLDLPPYVTTITGTGGFTQTRTLTLPPWPLITNGPPENWNSSTGPGLSTTASFSSWNFPKPPENPPRPTLPYISKPAYTGPENQEPTATWPPDWELIPVPTPVREEGEDDDGNGGKSKSTCTLWFFFVCIKWGGPFNIDIQGWEWNFPIGIWGPGPPPPKIKWPPGFTLKGTLPPWPKITVHPGGRIEPAPKPTDCKPAEAALCLTKSVFATTVSGGSTRTTATSVTETCATITGCSLRDIDTTTKADACTIRPRAVQETDISEPKHSEENTSRREERPLNASKIKPRATIPDWSCEQPGPRGVIWPAKPYDSSEQAEIRRILDDRKTKGNLDYIEIRAHDLGFTAFWVVESMGPIATAHFNSQDMPEIFLAYHPDNPVLPPHVPAQVPVAPVSGPLPRRSANGETVVTAPFGQRSVNNETAITEPSEKENTVGETTIAEPNQPRGVNNETMHTVQKRATLHTETTDAWYLSMSSWPKGLKFDTVIPQEHDPYNRKLASVWDDSFGQGQTIYIMENSIQYFNTEWSEMESDQPRTRLRHLPDGPKYGPSYVPPSSYDIEHGTVVAAIAGGQTRGIARKAEIVFVNIYLHTMIERTLEAFVKIAEDVAKKPVNTCVINMSWGMSQGEAISDGYYVIMMELMHAMQDKYGCAFVAAPGNDGQPASYFPSLAVSRLKGMFVVGAVDAAGQGYSRNTGLDIINAMAGGVDLPLFGTMHTGTSFAAPQVAGLIAYFRSHPSWTRNKDPSSMFAGITSLYRDIEYAGRPNSKYPIIWNGQTGNNCEPLKRSLESRQLGGGDSCPLPDGDSEPGGPDGPQEPQGPRVEFRSGDPAPTCTANCGKLCSGFYCVPNPTGTPPDFSSNPTAPTSPGSPNLPGLPELTPAPTRTAGPGEWCLSSTTVRECNGGPRGAPCITTTSCVSFGRPDLPDISTTAPPFSPSGGSCISSTTWTERGGPQFEAIITKSSCASWSTPTPTPTTTAKPDPPPAAARCMTAHFYIGTSPLGPDSWVLNVWDNGVEIYCNGKGGEKLGVSDRTVFEYDCRGGGSAIITEEGRNFKEYKAADGWTVKPVVRDYQHDTQKVGTGTSSMYETVYTAGDCSKCPKASLCDYKARCSFDGTCKS